MHALPKETGFLEFNRIIAPFLVKKVIVKLRICTPHDDGRKLKSQKISKELNHI